MDRRSLFIILGLFLVSVIIRLPNLDRPLSKHHEFAMAGTMMILHVAADNNAPLHSFQPRVSYNGKANKHIENHASGIVDEEGNAYYISQPPFSYILPLAVFRALDIYPTVIAVQWFNIVFHLLTVLILFRATQFISNTRAALFAAAVYTFTPITLWFHSNVYMADMFVQVFWAAGLYQTLVILRADKVRWTGYLLFGLITFFMLYTNWLGGFFVAAVSVWCIVQRTRFPLILAGALAAAAALTLMFWQYAQIAGPEVLGQFYYDRFFFRAGHREGLDEMLDMVLKVLLNYASSYLPILILLIILWLSRREKGGLSDLHFLGLGPVILLHGIFLQYSGHDFSSLPAAIWLSIAVGILVDRSRWSYAASGLSFALFLCVGLYYYINRPGTHSWQGSRYALQKEIAEEVIAEAADDEVVFLDGFRVEAPVVAQARRNMKNWKGKEKAYKFLRKTGQSRGVVVRIEDDWVDGAEHFVLPD